MKITIYTFTIDDDKGMRTLVFATAAERNAAIAAEGKIPGDPASPGWLDEQEDEIEAWRDSSAMQSPGWECYYSWEDHELKLPSVTRFSPEVIRRTRKALKDVAAGNQDCTMTDLDLACDMLDELDKTQQP